MFGMISVLDFRSYVRLSCLQYTDLGEAVVMSELHTTAATSDQITRSVRRRSGCS